MNMLIQKTLEHRVLPVPFHILTLVGVWCPKYVEPKFKRIYAAFTFFVLLSEVLLTLEVIINFVIILRRQIFDLDVFFIMISLINGLYKGIYILQTRRRIENLLTSGFEDRWRIPRDDSEQVILADYSVESWRIHLMYALACFAGVSIRLIGPMMKSNGEIEFPAPAWYPYDTSKPLTFWLSYVQQTFVGGAIISMHIGADTMVSGFLLQSCIQLKLLKHRLRNFFQHCKYTKSHSLNKMKVESALIRQYIYDHRFIYSYAHTLNNSFAGQLIAVLTVVVPNVCINVYLLSFSDIGLNVDFITSLGLFSISLFQIYLPCWYGNEVALHSAEIAKAVYEMDWVDLAPTTRKALIIIMIRAAEPIKLTVAHVIPMNINSLLSIMKTSYSVLSVLQQM